MTGPAVPPGGEELREAITRAVRDRIVSPTAGPTHWAQDAADVVLALPEMRDALAAQQKLRRVSSVLDALETPSTEAERDGCRATVDARTVARVLRAALSGGDS